jgi:hypothetical protein
MHKAHFTAQLRIHLEKCEHIKVSLHRSRVWRVKTVLRLKLAPNVAVALGCCEISEALNRLMAFVEADFSKSI